MVLIETVKDFETVKFIIKIYQNHDGNIVEFITYSKSIKFTMKKFAVWLTKMSVFNTFFYTSNFNHQPNFSERVAFS